MLKIKLFAIACVLCLVGVVLSGSHHLAASAESNILREIAEYKTWTRVTKEPIKVEFSLDLSDG